jgi:P4 family phage/plasmid primase-like protien
MATTTTTDPVVLTDMAPPFDQLDRDLEALLECLDAARWDDRTSWRDIGVALKTHGGLTPDRYFAVFDRYSRKSGKYDADAVQALWASANGVLPWIKRTIANVHFWAKEDDPEQYAQYWAERVSAVVLEQWYQGDRGLTLICGELLRREVKVRGSKTFRFDHDACVWLESKPADVMLLMSTRLDEVLRDLLILAETRPAVEAEQAYRHDEVKAIRKRIEYVSSAWCMRNLMMLVPSVLTGDAFDAEMDTVPHLLGVRNGVVDLRTGELRQRVPDDMIHTIAAVEYDPTADTTGVDGMVQRMMADDAVMTKYLQKLFGYMITGDVSEEVFPVFCGRGRNGKGVLMRALQRLLGDFYREMNVALITSRTCANIDAERAKLQGCRVAVFNELQEGEKLKIDAVQMLSGGDGIPACAKYAAPTTIEPRHTCVLTTNWMPTLDSVAPAIQQRLLCIEFPVTFVPLADGEEETTTRKRRDDSLKQRLDTPTERAAMLKWIVDGAVAWYAARDLKTGAPAKVRGFTYDYLSKQNVLDRFLHHCCVVNPDARVGSVELLRAFEDFTAMPSGSVRGLPAKMAAKGFEKKKLRVDGRSVQGYEGVGLKPDDCDDLGAVE